MTWLIYTLIVVWAISGVGLVILILMHSGKGTGVSDMISANIYPSMGGSNIVEKNLDRITFIFVAIFVICLLAMMLVYPLAHIG